MNADQLVLVPVHGSGRGRLVRTGRTVLLTASDSPAAAALVGWARLVGGRPATEVLDELTRLAGDGDAFGPFCALVVEDGGVELLAHASAPVVIRQGSSSEQVRADAGQRLVRRTVTGFAAIELLGSTGTVDPVLALDSGVVAADGFSLRALSSTPSQWSTPDEAPAEETGEVPSVPVATPPPEPAPEPTPAPPPAPVTAAPQAPAPAPAAPAAAAPPAMPQLVSLAAVDDDLPAAAPLPMAASIVAVQPEAEAAGRAAPRVQGVRCSRDHFNDPRARYCAVCGIAMHQASFILVEDARPPVGVLVFSDGSYHTIADRLIIGRDPSDDPLVRSNEATSLPLNDPTSTLSRVHAEIRLSGWDVHIVDRGSTNGTFVWAPGQAGWDRLAPNDPRVLGPGMHVAFGRLSATFESSLRQRG